MEHLIPDLNEHISNRIEKLEKIKAAGINPYPHNYDKKNNICELKLDEMEYQIAGRIILLRRMGKSVFLNLRDGSSEIQVYLHKSKVDNVILNLIETGDIIGVTGKMFLTKTEEKTLKAENLVILTKSIRPLPDKYQGLSDKEILARHRSIDMIANIKVRDRFINRSLAMRSIRRFMENRGFYEVETPILDTTYGGGEAKPFVSEVNAISSEVFLNVSPELYLKRYLVGGIEKAYTFARSFRNEGIDKTHYPEFTLFECYESYADYYDMMELMESLYETTFNDVLGTTIVDVNGTKVDFKAPWIRMKMLDRINEFFNINLSDMTDEELLEFSIKNLNMSEYEIQNMSRGYQILNIFETHCEHLITQPTFVMDYPYETSPLCKLHRNNEKLIERFEPFVMGIELGNAYSELNDPIRQRRLLLEQSDKLRAGLETASPMDEAFAVAIDIGMPPTGGLGIGIDRLMMFLTGANHIKDVIGFPLTKKM